MDLGFDTKSIPQFLQSCLGMAKDFGDSNISSAITGNALLVYLIKFYGKM